MKSGKECTPQAEEMVKRSRMVMGKLSHGDIEHVDLGFYFLHCNANHQHQKVFMKRKDVMHCTQRLEVMWPLVSADQIPDPVVEKLPAELNQMLEGKFKVEWHYDNKLITWASDEYKERFGVNLKGDRSIYKKCVDTMGFEDCAMALKMWLESVMRPGKVITYKGAAFMVGFEKPIIQSVLVVSLVWDYNHFITVTQAF